jgi:LysR family transcriptional regulator, low CO2-responsive transcriptional regulator
MTDLRSLTLKQLRALAATVEARSVTGAAKALFLTPPAITIQLKLLEANVGSPLFERGAANFQPTEIGHELLGVARDFERLVTRAGERIAALQSGATGSIVFGVVSTAKYLAPSIVASFRAAYPDIRVKLVIGNRGAVIRGLEQDEFDILLMGRPPAHVEVESHVMGDHPHVMIAAPDHRLAGALAISGEDLLRERILAREPGSGTRMLMERFLERAGRGRPFEVVEMGSNETIKQSVMAGLGVAIISAHTCLSELADGKLITLQATGLPLVRQWFLLNRAGRPKTRAAEIFRDWIAAHRRALFPSVAAHDRMSITPAGKKARTPRTGAPKRRRK